MVEWYGIAASIVYGSLVIMPGVLFAVRFFRPRLMPWWWLTVLIVCLGWALLNLGVDLREVHLDHLVSQMSEDETGWTNPIWTEWREGEVVKLFALYRGWIVGPVLTALWSPLIGLAYGLRWYLARSSHKASRSHSELGGI